MKKLALLWVLLFVSVHLFSCEKGDEEAKKEAKAKSVLNPTSEYIAIFGDIQGQTVNLDKLTFYQNSVNWIENQLDLGYKINAVLQVGDITGANIVGQWKNFYNATYRLAQKVPFFAAIGDHDYTWTGKYIDDRYDTFFNDYVQFPLSVSKVVDYFEEGRMENVVVENYIHGMPYYFIIMEFGPRSEVMDWARAVVGNNSDKEFILLTHEYLESGGGIRTKNLKSAARLRNTSYNTPTEVFEGLVSVYDYILCVLCGHVGSLYAFTYNQTEYGREVPEIQYNIQEEPYNSDSWLMLWEFPIDSDSASVFIYNTKTNKYYNNKKVLFKFKYTNEPPITSIKETRSKANSNVEYNLSGQRLSSNRIKNQLLIRGGKKYAYRNR